MGRCTLGSHVSFFRLSRVLVLGRIVTLINLALSGFWAHGLVTCAQQHTTVLVSIWLEVHPLRLIGQRICIILLNVPATQMIRWGTARLS